MTNLVNSGSGNYVHYYASNTVFDAYLSKVDGGVLTLTLTAKEGLTEQQVLDGYETHKGVDGYGNHGGWFWIVNGDHGNNTGHALIDGITRDGGTIPGYSDDIVPKWWYGQSNNSHGTGAHGLKYLDVVWKANDGTVLQAIELRIDWEHLDPPPQSPARLHRGRLGLSCLLAWWKQPTHQFGVYHHRLDGHRVRHECDQRFRCI